MRCQFCRGTEGAMVAGEPRRVGIERGSTRYRTVVPYWHPACYEATESRMAAARERDLAELRQSLLEANPHLAAVLNRSPQV